MGEAVSNEDKEALDIIAAFCEIASEALGPVEGAQFILAMQFGQDAWRCNVPTGFVSNPVSDRHFPESAFAKKC